VLREADAHGWERFHLVGYSGGGAASLAFAAANPERLASLALLEPAWAGSWDLSPAEKALWVQFDRLEELPVEEFLPTFMRLGLKPGVPLPPPPPGDPPPWMAKRPAGIRAINRAFKRGYIDGEALRRFDRPVYFALGALSNPDQ
jgi:pimeloyl-ACP methyl ester carboxylesterase